MCQFEYLQLRDFEQRGALKQKLHCKNGHFGPKVPPLEGIELQSGPTSRLSRWGFVSRFKVGFVFTLFFIFDTPQYSLILFPPLLLLLLLLLPPSAPSFGSFLLLPPAAPSYSSPLPGPIACYAHCRPRQVPPGLDRSCKASSGLAGPF